MLLPCIVVAALWLQSGWAAEDGAVVPDSTQTTDFFAMVGGQPISIQEYEMALRAGLRKRFYHGKVPEEKLEEFRREVADTLINRVLLLNEAQRRGLRPNDDEVQGQLAQYQARYRQKPMWQEHKDEVLTSLRVALERESLLRLLEARVRDVPAPSNEEVKAFYARQPELFTTPEAFRVSLILLKVDPASPPAVWEAAFEEARSLVERLDNGADFSQLARIHSGDESAVNGGDMGYLHKGMLAEPAQQIVEQLAPGEVSQPVMLLQGIAVLRLEERRLPALNAFEQVASRARQLLLRQRSDDAWQALIARLREQTEIVVNTAVIQGGTDAAPAIGKSARAAQGYN